MHCFFLQAQARVAAAMVPVRESPLWQFMQQLQEAPGVPRGLLGGGRALELMRGDWAILQGKLMQSFGPDGDVDPPAGGDTTVSGQAALEQLRQQMQQV